MAQPPLPTPHWSRPRRAVRALQRGATACMLLLLGLWAVGALYFQASVAWAVAGGLVTAGLIVASLRMVRLRGVWICGALLACALALWWGQFHPRTDRDWADDVAHLVHMRPATSSATPQIVELQQVRNFTWRSETDYTPRWETRRIDLSQLRSLDLGVSYWMGPAIAHTLVSFGMADGQHLVFSVEIRKERHEQFDALAGFFKQYELALIAADERDILAVRTNVRGEQVHLYRVPVPPQTLRDLFLAYAQQADALALAPRYYHTLTANCTTLVWQLARSIGQTLPLDWRLLASGYVPEYLYQLQALQPGIPLAQLRALGDITQRAQQWQPPEAADERTASADFSRWIRQGMPGT